MQGDTGEIARLEDLAHLQRERAAHVHARARIAYHLLYHMPCMHALVASGMR